LIGSVERKLHEASDMRSVSPKYLAVVLVMGAAASGCNRVSASERGAPAVRPVDAIDTLVAERCARAERCGDVGKGKEWMSAGHCAAQSRIDSKVDLNSHVCPEGVLPSRLKECLAALSAPCDKAFGAITRTLSCRVGRLCK
jgi:hypothetical protein